MAIRRGWITITMMLHSHRNPCHNCARHAWHNCAKSGCAASSATWGRISRLLCGARQRGRARVEDRHLQRCRNKYRRVRRVRKVRLAPGDQMHSLRCGPAPPCRPYHQDRCRRSYKRHLTGQCQHSQARCRSFCGLVHLHLPARMAAVASHKPRQNPRRTRG